MAILRRTRVRALAALLALLPVSSCVDGPFAHASPFDRESGLQLAIVGGLDTVRVANAEVLYQLVTVPVVNGYTAEWTSSAPRNFEPLGEGRFIVRQVPVANFPVQIRARFLPGKEAVRSVVITVAP